MKVRKPKHLTRRGRRSRRWRKGVLFIESVDRAEGTVTYGWRPNMHEYLKWKNARLARLKDNLPETQEV